MRFTRMLRPLLAADLCFIAVHILLVALVAAEVFHRGWVTRTFLISADRSLAEDFMYLKWAGAAALMALASYRAGGTALFAAFAVTSLILLADDSVQLHEGIGKSLAIRFNFPAIFGLRPQDLGELMVWAGLGSVIVLMIGYGLLRASPEEMRIAPYFLCTLGLLIVAGIGMDMVHVAVTEAISIPWLHGIADLLLTLLEDGGELILSSFMVGYGLVAVGARDLALG